jgi:hypothetical protein
MDMQVQLLFSLLVEMQIPMENSLVRHLVAGEQRLEDHEHGLQPLQPLQPLLSKHKQGLVAQVLLRLCLLLLQQLQLQLVQVYHKPAVAVVAAARRVRQQAAAAVQLSVGQHFAMVPSSAVPVSWLH